MEERRALPSAGEVAVKAVKGMGGGIAPATQRPEITTPYVANRAGGSGSWGSWLAQVAGGLLIRPVGSSGELSPHPASGWRGGKAHESVYRLSLLYVVMGPTPSRVR